MMFASILVSGIQLITKEPITSREITIVSVALGLGYGLGSTAGATSELPYYIQLIFGGSGIVPAAVAAIVLNIIIPKEKKKQNKEQKRKRTSYVSGKKYFRGEIRGSFLLCCPAFGGNCR